MNERGAGWAGFAAILFLVIGIWNIIEGVFGLARSSFWTSTGAHYTISDLRTWSWIVLIWGVIELLAGLSIMAGGSFGRWAGIFIAGVAIIIQLMFLPAYPFWALIAIFVYVMIMYGLIVYPIKAEN
jgi:hypothetical protein